MTVCYGYGEEGGRGTPQEKATLLLLLFPAFSLAPPSVNNTNLVSFSIAPPELLSLRLAQHNRCHDLQVGGVGAHRHLYILVGPPDEPVDVSTQVVLHVSGHLCWES